MILAQKVLLLLPEYGAFMLNGQVLNECRYHCENKGRASPDGRVKMSKK